jgi:hypothetical protein
MSETQATPVEAVEAVVTFTPKSVAQRASRKRFSFGPVWNAAVIAGKVTDEAKLLEHAVKLKVGSRSDLKKLKLATLRTKVAAKLQAETVVAPVEQA